MIPTLKLIKSVLTDDLRRSPWKGNPCKVAGHCYVASEALYHLLGGPKSLWRPCFIRHEGSPHWFLVNLKTNSILDPTVAQFKTTPSYKNGVRKGFLTKKPSKRARVVLERLKSVLRETKER